ncbi:Methylmalonate-semialdehyde dehydrogenase [acylating] [Sporomusa silvacetica DSM 10669]|uniref:methylmalonate-semialdehyde dehydrogenase (CoA acylating) n=1 Tax=Sporomusa silvacetica DSM 10669 TaxID=1123289 RepID=A0ABZ3IN51_9FIRM|nr:CoA-acylating methylmalonate-semialdehyde dehydrogenase [Sporomusa silvacetica]OZC14355.1 methylmalonate-semialdehyde dehydrogenase [Sporomusa silvacetica DSM 10669]
MVVKRLKYCVNGEWKESATTKYMPITDSNTGKVIAEAPCCTVDEVNEAVAAAKAAFSFWSATPVSVRAQLMFKYKAILDTHLEELATFVATELGKNLNEARGDVLKAIEVVELACSTPTLMQGDSLMNVSGGHDTVMYREPLGVFAGIVPYNFPAMIPFGWMIPLCIATGNTFVLKAASAVPQTAVRMLELLIEVGLPKGVVNLVTCSRNEAAILPKHPDIAGISYVGSTSVGLHIYSTAAAHGKRVQALCEAKNHGLVLKDASLGLTAGRVINSGFGCAGQRCMALSVICVEEEVADEFVAHLVKFAKEIKVGPGYDATADLGPVVSAEHKQSVMNWIAKGIEEGAELILDGRDISVQGYEGGFFLGPTIFDHVKEGMSIGDSEIFGPVVCIKRVKNFEHGLAVMNANPFANGSCIFTQSGYYAREFAQRTHGGMVGINVGIPVPISVFPFSGHKQSFFGDLHCMGKDGVAFFTEVKSVTSRWFDKADAKHTKVDTWEGTMTRK